MPREIKFAQMVEKYMRRNNYTMRELGEKVGKTESTVSYWISGKSIPRMGTIQELAGLFGITTDTMVYGDDSNDLPNFSTAEEAMAYILRMPVVSAYGGYDIDKMSDEEIINFANKLAGVFKMLAEEYKDK